MKQLKIRCSQEFFWVVIVDFLYQNILIKDDKWHFFFEGTYHVIRFDEAVEKDIVKLMKEKEELHEELKEYHNTWWISNYNENIGVTKKYINEFIPIFHNLSLLTIKTETNDLWGVTNRVFHCFSNMLSEREVINACIKKTGSNYMKEANFYMIHALMSAFNQGIFHEMKKGR